MISPRLQRTLRYCAVLFLVIVPAYYFVYKLLWDDVSSGEAFTTSLIYGVLNVLFLGALHYYRVSNRVEEEDKG
ncbi:hypothetical protein [Neolewinella persica]|uniref:hypothetical protein n=1 Tax=Neolewinella persica TaxID=70998 RepID=UPI0003697D98|nr:hypothetical protein [Neolewinella persica]